MAASVQVEGWRELNRAFDRVDKTIRKDLTKQIKTATEPMAIRTQQLALGSISNMGPKWSRMRIGVTAKVVYMVPKAKRSGGSRRPNLAPLLYDRAMAPAFDHHQQQVVDAVEVFLDQSIRRAGF